MDTRMVLTVFGSSVLSLMSVSVSVVHVCRYVSSLVFRPFRENLRMRGRVWESRLVRIVLMLDFSMNFEL